MVFDLLMAWTSSSDTGTEEQDVTTQIDKISGGLSLMINADKIKTMVIEKTKSHL